MTGAFGRATSGPTTSKRMVSLASPVLPRLSTGTALKAYSPLASSGAWKLQLPWASTAAVPSRVSPS